MNPIVKSWKTTATGVVGIISALAFAFSQYLGGGLPAVNWEILLAAVVAGVGFIFAKDAGVTNAVVAGPAVSTPKVP
jgi:uncharacterized membrane protein YjjP (DUF1212 family)